MSYARFASIVAAVCLLCVNPFMRATSIPGQDTAPADALQRPLDQILDVNVRDGLVYYRALRGERGNTPVRRAHSHRGFDPADVEARRPARYLARGLMSRA